MTNGQIQQLQDLNKCYLPRIEKFFVSHVLELWKDRKLNRVHKRWIRGLTHQYRNQIKAMKRNAN